MWDVAVNGAEMPGGIRIAAERIIYADGDMSYLTIDPTKFTDMADFCHTLAHVLLVLTEAA